MAPYASSAARRTPWERLRVQVGDPSLPTTVTGPARLIALYQWRRGHALPGVWIIENATVPTRPRRAEDVDWAQFPILEAQLEMMALEGCELPWFSAVVGGDLFRTPVARATLERGGHLRVGLEDHFGGRQPSNLELVEEVAALCAEVGRPIAGPAEAGRVLGIPPRPGS